MEKRRGNQISAAGMRRLEEGGMGGKGYRNPLNITSDLLVDNYYHYH